MKKIIFELLFFFFSFQISAQITIDGNVLDSDSNPIDNALVVITDQNDTTNYYSAITNGSGYFLISNITEVTSNKSIFPIDYIVLRNYPNPFNPSTIIYYELPKSEKIEIKIYDILGRQVRTLYNNFQKAGIYNIEWDGRNNWNSPVAAGIYFCRLKSKDNFKVNKMVLLDGGSTSPSITNSRLNKIQPQRLTKVNSVLNYSIRVSGDNILKTEFNYLSCTGDTTINLIVPKILAFTTIGPEGGKLETDDFSLIIPEGAFNEDTELKLGIDQNYTPNLGTRITDVFRVQGLPYFYFAPLKIMIKHNFEFHDSLTIISGTTNSDPTTDIEEISFDYFDANDSLGYIVSYLPARDSNSFTQFYKRNKISKATYLGFYIFTGLAGVRDYTTNHFAASFDKIEFLTLVPILLENFEDIFAWFNNLLSLKEEEVTKKIQGSDIEVDFVKNNKNSSARPNRYLYFTRGSWPISENKIVPTSEFNIHIYEDKFNTENLNIIKRDQAHYFYMFYPFKYLTIYTPPDNFIENYKLSTQFWLHHAIASWSEEFFSQINNFIPLDFKLHFMEPFNGIQSFLETSPSFLEGHGIGMSALIKHFTNSYGNNIIGKFFNALKTNSNALEVIIDTLAYTYTSESIWWPNFFKEYIQGQIYNVSGEEFLKNVSETIEFNDGDTLKYVDDQFTTYNDLSAKLFRINLNSDKIKENNLLRFKIGPESLNLDYAKTLVFGINENNLSYIGEGVDFNVSYLNLYDGLLACVVNSGNEPPYTGTSNINLTISTHKVLPRAIISLNAHFLQDLHVKTQYDEYDATGVDYVYNDWYGTAELINDSTYFCIWDEDDQVGYHHIGNLKVIIDPFTHNLKYFEAEEVQDGDGFTIINEKIKSNIGINIPTFSITSTKWTYLIRGAEACSITNSLEYSKRNDNWNETMTNFSCSESSSILISLDFDQ